MKLRLDIQGVAREGGVLEGCCPSLPWMTNYEVSNLKGRRESVNHEFARYASFSAHPTNVAHNETQHGCRHNSQTVTLGETLHHSYPLSSLKILVTTLSIN